MVQRSIIDNLCIFMISVLQHQGGWLVDSDQDTGFRDDEEEGVQRKKEIKDIRYNMWGYCCYPYYFVEEMWLQKQGE